MRFIACAVCQCKNIRHQSDWSKVSLYPSPSFLSKNQLAKEGPDSVAPVVIPALAPTLDRSLKSDRSLCLVRALRYCLDRTSDIRQNKELVFVSFKKGFGGGGGGVGGVGVGVGGGVGVSLDQLTGFC